MAEIHTVLVKLASRCNLDCDYCYVYRMSDDGWREQPKKITIKTISAVAHQLGKLARFQDRNFSVVFHGGEPLLVGAAHLSQICQILRTALPKRCVLSIQTNGTLLSNEILAICAEWNVTIAISIDGPASVHDKHRVDHRGRSSHKRVMEAVQRLLRHPSGRRLFSGVLGVIDLSSQPENVYEFLKSTGTPSIDFLYRDGNHDLLPAGKLSVDSTEYGRWMGRLLDYYLLDPHPIPIRMLDDMIKSLLLRGAREPRALEEPGIVIIDTDGTIKKNDILKSAYRDADKFSSQWSVLTHDLIELVNSAEFVEYHESQRPSAPVCQTCPDLDVCGGGIPAHRWSQERGFINPSIFCADQRYLVSLMRSRLSAHNLSVA
jgi:uncharacterized protein